MTGIALKECYRGRIEFGSCIMGFSLHMNYALYKRHYDAFNGTYTEDTDMALIRDIMTITITREEQGVELSDLAYSFFNIILSTMMDTYDKMVSGQAQRPHTIKFASYWDFPVIIDEILDPEIFPGIHSVVQ